MTRKKRTILIVTSCLCVVAAEETEKVAPVGPAFNADSAYAYTKAQCDFGPRDMNSKGHDACGEWIVAQFERLGCKVTRQNADLKGYDGTILHSMNIMASYNPNATTRIMLCAHWDSRPWADNDPDSTNWHKPILAANDAASGVAVMLELARLLAQKSVAAKLPQNLGVDFVCFDAERHSGATGKTTVALGHSARNIFPPTCRKATLHDTPSCWIWSADRALSSIRKACRNSMRPKS